jgi:hypothetical protein
MTNADGLTLACVQDCDVFVKAWKDGRAASSLLSALMNVDD